MKRSITLIIVLFVWTGVAQATPLVGGHYKTKWEQAPDMGSGTDYLSMHRTNGPIVADDFQSDGRDIYGFHWWGSYFQGVDVGQTQDPTVERNISFEISFHNDCPAFDPSCGRDVYNYSTPSTDYTSVIVNAEEDFFGITASGETVYEYWVLLPVPWKEIAGETYWVDFGWNEGQALFNAAGGQYNTFGDIWGWHESSEHWNDFAVTTNTAFGGNPHAGTWNVIDGRDMAFEVITVPEPTSILLMGIGLAGLSFARKRKGHRLTA